jgi:hypothetical protein
MVGNYESIENLPKSWIPYILILKQRVFRGSILADIRGWVRSHGKVT